MRWPPWKRRNDTNHVEEAKADADHRLDEAHELARRGDATSRRAYELARRTNRFAREVERALHLRGQL